MIKTGFAVIVGLEIALYPAKVAALFWVREVVGCFNLQGLELSACIPVRGRDG